LKDEKTFFQHQAQVPSALAWICYIISIPAHRHHQSKIIHIPINPYFHPSISLYSVLHLRISIDPRKTCQSASSRYSSATDTVSGNRTILFVIVDRYLIVHVLLIIVSPRSRIPSQQQNVRLTIIFHSHPYIFLLPVLYSQISMNPS
jgi:hypothetical protein